MARGCRCTPKQFVFTSFVSALTLRAWRSQRRICEKARELSRLRGHEINLAFQVGIVFGYPRRGKSRTPLISFLDRRQTFETSNFFHVAVLRLYVPVCTTLYFVCISKVNELQRNKEMASAQFGNQFASNFKLFDFVGNEIFCISDNFEDIEKRRKSRDKETFSFRLYLNQFADSKFSIDRCFFLF